jgi:hypothetical protein
MSISKYRRQIGWLTIIYAGILVSVFYPGLHEGFAASIIFWNCVPPTIGFVLMIAAFGKSCPISWLRLLLRS